MDTVFSSWLFRMRTSSPGLNVVWRIRCSNLLLNFSFVWKQDFSRVAFHWGQECMYLGFTWWLHCDFLSTSLSKKPLGTCWVFLKRKPHFDHNVPSDHMVITFEKKTAQKPVGSLWKKALVSFTILFTMYLLWIWATHWEFFHKILYDVITMSPEVSLQRNLKEIILWLSFATNSQRTLWVYGWIHCDYTAEYFMKEVSMSGSDPE